MPRLSFGLSFSWVVWTQATLGFILLWSWYCIYTWKFSRSTCNKAVSENTCGHSRKSLVAAWRFECTVLVVGDNGVTCLRCSVLSTWSSLELQGVALRAEAIDGKIARKTGSERARVEAARRKLEVWWGHRLVREVYRPLPETSLTKPRNSMLVDSLSAWPWATLVSFLSMLCSKI